MSAEENKALVRRFIEAYNKRNLDVFEELVAEDYTDHTHNLRGREDFKRLFTLAFQGFPDWYEEIEDMIAEDDRVWVRVKATGTHSGEWNPFGVSLPATGKKVTMTMVFYWSIAGGRLAEGGEVDDSLDFMTQLGLIRYTAKGEKFFPEESG